MPTRPRNLLLITLAALLLTGCLRDTASYQVDRASEQAIILVRNQDLFWKDTVTLTVIAEQARQCSEGLDIEDVPRDAEIRLYAPPEGVYAHAIYILDVDDRYFAVATAPCGVTPFTEAPEELGKRIGSFQEDETGFRFTPAEG